MNRKNNNEKVAIIVPIYNVEKYLPKCIESLINQTYKNLEIFLVDDGSPDNCGKICDKYARKDKRIVVIHKENGGYGSVLEYSIKNITSNYFLICDSDDWLEPTAIEKLYGAMKDNNVDLVIGGKNYVYSDGTVVNELIENRNFIFKNIIPNKKSVNLVDYVYLPQSPHSKLYKTKYAKNIEFPQKISYTDLLLYYVYISRISSAMFIDETLSNYYFDRPGNTVEEGKTLKASSFKAVVIQRKSIIKQLEKGNLSNYILGYLIYLTARVVCSIPQNVTDKEIQDYKSELINIILQLKPYKKYIKKINIIVSSTRIKAYIKNVVVNFLCNKYTINFGIFLLKVFRTGD